MSNCDVQEEGPTEADVNSLRSIEQRNWETLQQENAYWLEMLTTTYMSRSYSMVGWLLSQNSPDTSKLEHSAH